MSYIAGRDFLKKTCNIVSIIINEENVVFVLNMFAFTLTSEVCMLAGPCPTLDRDAAARSRCCSPIEMLWRD